MLITDLKAKRDSLHCSSSSPISLPNRFNSSSPSCTFVDEACHQIERNERNVRQTGVLSYIPRFATLATRMEQYIQGQSRELVDQAYTKLQFERLFQFNRRIDDLMYTISSEEIPFQLGLSKADLRKVVKSSLSGVDKSLTAMYKKLQKNLTSEEILPTLWEKCKKEFLDKYENFAQTIGKIYPTESIPSAAEMQEQLESM